MARYRILSLDGGGAWALIQVRALAAIYGEAAKGHDILADFDLVAANSGGSIVAAGLAEDLSLAQILTYFKDEKKRRAIFVEMPFYRKIARLIGLGPRYYTAAKLKGLRDVMPNAGNRVMAALPDSLRHGARKRTHFLLVGFDYDRERAVFFRSDTGSLASSGGGGTVTLAEAVHASTNAPINYFDEPAAVTEMPPRKPPRRFWDGAITGLNNPVVAAVVEAKANKALNADIEVLSIGTGNLFLPMAGGGDRAASPKMMQQQATRLLLKDIQRISRSILADPPDAATFIAHVILEQHLPPHGEDTPCYGGSSVVRLNPLIQPFWNESGKIWDWPTDAGGVDFPVLAAMDMDAVKNEEVDQIDRFCSAWMNNKVYNQPLRVKTARLKCDIGHRWFSDALAEWNRRMAG